MDIDDLGISESSHLFSSSLLEARSSLFLFFFQSLLLKDFQLGHEFRTCVHGLVEVVERGLVHLEIQFLFNGWIQFVFIFLVFLDIADVLGSEAIDVFQSVAGPGMYQ